MFISATSKHQTLTFLVFVSANKCEEWPTGAAMKATHYAEAIHYADVTGKAATWLTEEESACAFRITN